MRQDLSETWPLCWCGGICDEPLVEDYRFCSECGTLVSRWAADRDKYMATDSSGYYGSSYWLRHVPEDLRLPKLEERARSDLVDRGPSWLRWIAAHRPPPAAVLELGCAHGGLVYLLAQAGYDAEGLEMSRAVIHFASERFGVTVHLGPLEEAALKRSYDIIVAMDVLEHLPAPHETLASVYRHLTEDGLVFLQTPCYRDDGGEWPMLLPEEHLYLFTERSLTRLLRAAGFAAVAIEPALFSYDMWVVAARRGEPRRRDDFAARLPPVAVALIDAARGSLEQAVALAAIEEDRRSKQADVDLLTRELCELRVDQQAKDRLIVRLSNELVAIEEDRRAKDEVVTRLQREIATIDADRQAKDAILVRVSREARQIEVDRAAKEAANKELAVRLDGVETDRQNKQALIEVLSKELREIRSDQRAKHQLIADISEELREVRSDQAAKQQLIEQISAELAEVRTDQQAKERLIARLAAPADETHEP